MTKRVDDDQLEEIVEYALGFYPVGSTDRIDWEDLLLRIEQACDIDLPENYMDPEIKRIKAAINKARREG